MKQGSPPHPRGIFLPGYAKPVRRRFTPASTGNIIFAAIYVLISQVHPRIHGEYLGIDPTTKTLLGSPPHPRGIFTFPLSTHLFHGFTPASTGNIAAYTSFRSAIRVHPRIHGEYTKQILIFPHFSPYHASNFI